MDDEIITIQLGEYSNFVGTHFWNSLEMTIDDPRWVTRSLYRRNKSGVANPRLLVFNPKGKLGSLSVEGMRVKPSQVKNQDVLWNNNVKRFNNDDYQNNLFLEALDKKENMDSKLLFNNIKYLDQLIKDLENEKQKLNENKDNVSEKIRKGVEGLGQKYIDLEIKVNDISQKILDTVDIKDKEIKLINQDFNLNKNVKNWTDYLKTNLHSKTIYECNFGGYSDAPVNSWSSGTEIFKENTDDIMDRFRFLAEETDKCQGFQVFVDSDTGFGSLAANILTEIQQEYNKLPISIFGLYGKTMDDKEFMSKRILNLGLSLHKFSELGTVYVPLSYKHWKPTSFPLLNYDVNNFYQTSSIFGAVLDTLTTPYRLSKNGITMSDMYSDLVTPSRNICSIETSYPFPIGENDTLESIITDKFTPLHNTNNMFSLTPNMVKTDYLTPYSLHSVLRGVDNSKFTGREYYDPQSYMTNYLNHLDCFAKCTFYSEPFYTPISYPRIFKYNEDYTTRLFTIPIFSHIQTTPQQYYNMKLISDEFKKLHPVYYQEANLEKDEYLSISHHLDSIHENYNHSSFDTQT